MVYLVSHIINLWDSRLRVASPGTRFPKGAANPGPGHVYISQNENKAVNLHIAGVKRLSSVFIRNKVVYTLQAALKTCASHNLGAGTLAKW